MKVYTEIVISMITGKVLKEESFEYTGPIALCKGATVDQRALGQDQMAFYHQIMQGYSDVFSNATNIMSSLKQQFQPVLDRGINAYGFSLPQDSNLRSIATTNVGQQYKNAAAAAGDKMAAVGGGNVALPSGTESKIQRGLATEAAQADANAQLGITKAGYDVGRENFLKAASIMSSAPRELFDSAAPFAQAGTGAGADAAKTEAQIAQEDYQASFGAAVGGILGGAASSASGAAVKGAMA